MDDHNIHDIAVDVDGRPVSLNILFGCLATLNPAAIFTVVGVAVCQKAFGGSTAAVSMALRWITASPVS